MSLLNKEGKSFVIKYLGLSRAKPASHITLKVPKYHGVHGALKSAQPHAENWNIYTQMKKKNNINSLEFITVLVLLVFST